MARKVGDAYIDVETRLDEDNFVRASRLMAKRAADSFGKDYAANVQRSLRESDAVFDTHINKQISSFQSLERQRVRAAEDSPRRMTKIYNDIASETESNRRFSAAAEKEGARAAKAFEDEHNKAFSRITTSYQ